MPYKVQYKSSQKPHGVITKDGRANTNYIWNFFQENFSMSIVVAVEVTVSVAIAFAKLMQDQWMLCIYNNWQEKESWN